MVLLEEGQETGLIADKLITAVCLSGVSKVGSPLACGFLSESMPKVSVCVYADILTQ